MDISDVTNILDIINKCFRYISPKYRSKGETLDYCLQKICVHNDVDYGFIGEKIVDDNNKIFFRYYAIYGVPEESSIMEMFKKNGYVDIYNKPNSLHNKVLETGNFVVYNNIKFDPIDHVTIESFCAFPMKIENNIIGCIELSRNKNRKKSDFTEDNIKKIEIYVPIIENFIINIKNAENLERHKMSFIANMSHEVRTPLNSIITMIDMLRKTELTNTQADYIESIQICGVQLMNIINDILDYSKIISTGLKLNMVPMSINKCVKSVYAMASPKAEEKKLQFTYKIDSNVPDMIMCDSTRFKQILLNLLSNAIKFTKKGSIHTEIQLISDHDTECELLCFVKDTGIGIPSEKIDKIFDTFRQIDNDYLSDNFGTGLGLPISRHIVEKLEGKIWIDSIFDSGTVVQFTMTSKICKNNANEEMLQNYFFGKNVLIIDNDKTEKMLLFKELTRFKIKPILSTAEEAVIYLCDDTFKFELIIVGSGDTDGLMKIRLVKNYRVKIVIIDIDSSTDRYMDYDYKIVRPIDTSKILNVLNLIFIGSNKQNTHNKFFDSSSDSVDSPTHIKSSILNNIKVLYAEDNKQNQKVMTILLNSMGIHNIVLANDGFEAYDKLLNEDFDIALIDLKMPIMNGIDVVTKFLHTCKKSTILIAVTASVTEDIRKKCQYVGMHGFVAKPICYNDLESIINSAISNKLKKLNSSFYN